MLDFQFFLNMIEWKERLAIHTFAIEIWPEYLFFLLFVFCF